MTRGPDRRALLLGAGLATALPFGAAGQNIDAFEDEVVVSKKDSVVRTAQGELRGYRRNGVIEFKGVPYAGEVGGLHRFRRAPAPLSWTGVRNALNYGPICPQPTDNADRSTTEYAFLLPRGPRCPQSEDCLRVNIWSPGLAGRAPVMVWLHANGFQGGSGNDFLAADGENLARDEKVVVVTLNHRLGPLGYMDLRHVSNDPALLDSGNVGMLDIIDALKWLRTNVAAFGGDPGSVTVFGQSGGGFKVSALLAMPEAEGLFHRAIIQSGARLRVNTADAAQALTTETLKVLEIRGRPLQALLDLPADQLVAASLKAMGPVEKTFAAPGDLDPQPWYWQPVAGTPALPRHPFDPDAAPVSRRVPLIVSTVLNEAAPEMDDPGNGDIGWTGVATALRPDLAGRTDKAIEAYRACYPAGRPVDGLSMLSGRRFRLSAVALCERRSAAGSAAVYNSLFQWRTAVFDGRPGAFHTADVPFVFGNTDLIDTYTGGGERARRLSATMRRAWANFARTGDPNGTGVPIWPVFSAARPIVMVFDDHSQAGPPSDARLVRALIAS